MTEPAKRANRVLGGRPALRALLVSLLCFVAGCVAFLVSFGVTFGLYGQAGIDALSGFLLLDLLVGVAACIAVGPVRRSTAGNAILIVTGIFSAFALPAWIVAVIRFGERRSLPLDAAIVAVMVIGATGVAMWQDAALGAEAGNPLLAAGVAAGPTAAALLWGRVRGTRDALLEASRERAVSAELARAAVERSRGAELARARAEERGALARDLHDGISHRLSVVAMHAGALASREDLSPEQIQGATRTIRDAAAEAGELLREALTALRDPAERPSGAPLPTAASIETLVAEARARGARVSLHWQDLTPEELAGAAAQAVTLARVTEEVLMNAAKHAPGEPLEIEIARQAGAVALRARNRLAERRSGSPLGTGHGLIGVSERASLLGGHAAHGPTGDGGFEVEVRLPWT
ncbi:sensor histidine kinase [Leucobacter sp. wl10]|uniref:sensor histidine kinase n=1 Tax=Leucobacter sp. wl10 TaxID=2304677 RepID=UPI000E5B4BD3|nr:histidine kinase [Leucobacter sp. wl10]RGE20382.1 hypothetical protein D1J51_09385 [Leucobacter sp. wl10]